MISIVTHKTLNKILFTVSLKEQKMTKNFIISFKLKPGENRQGGTLAILTSHINILKSTAAGQNASYEYPIIFPKQIRNLNFH